MKKITRHRPKSRILTDGIFMQSLGTDITSEERPTHKAVFLDRDGTINIERGYILDPIDIELDPTAGKAIRFLNKLDILTIIITNQAAIDKKLLSPDQFERINEKLWMELSSSGAYYDALYFCPHSPSVTPGCDCRKPKPGLILQAAKDFNINLSSSFMIGDKLSDIEAGHLSGCKTVFLTDNPGDEFNHNLEKHSGTSPDFTCRNLGEAISLLRSMIQ